MTPRSHTPARAVRRLPSLALALLVARGAGCASQRDHGASAGERDAPAGIDVCTLGVEARPSEGRSVGELLANYENHPLPGDPRVLDAWRACGLRVVSIPKDEVAAFRAALTPVGPAQEQWFGQIPRWTQIARGPDSAGAMAIGMDNGLLRLPAGALRLLGRAWVVPMEPGASSELEPQAVSRAGLRLEMVPQHDEAAAKQASWLAPAKTEDRTLDAGLVFSRLGWNATLPGTHAIVIIPEAPGESWTVPPSREGEPLGPAFRPPATLGEAMLASESGARRLVVIITPSTPEKFELLK